MRYSETIALYQSKSLEEMSRVELEELKIGFLDWTLLPEYRRGTEKRHTLDKVLEKINGLLDENEDVRNISSTLL